MIRRERHDVAARTVRTCVLSRLSLETWKERQGNRCGERPCDGLAVALSRLEEVVEIDIGRDATTLLASRETSVIFRALESSSALLVYRHENDEENAPENRSGGGCSSAISRLHSDVFVNFSFSFTPGSLFTYCATSLNTARGRSVRGENSTRKYLRRILLVEVSLEIVRVFSTLFPPLSPFFHQDAERNLFRDSSPALDMQIVPSEVTSPTGRVKPPRSFVRSQRQGPT